MIYSKYFIESVLVSKDNELLSKIGGSIIANSYPNQALKSWRERLSIKQVDLARIMDVSPSVLSDYESGRRPSPGISFVRRYIEALIELDKKRDKFLEKLTESSKGSAILDIGEFHESIPASEVVKLVDGKILSGEKYLERKIYGFTLLDSIQTIYSLSGFDYYNIFGATTERVLIFTNVGLGRSPLVAIRVSQFKPRMVVLHGPKSVDKLAIDLAKQEQIILSLSSIRNKNDFSKLFERMYL
jgi:putative transcriptional regulator